MARILSIDGGGTKINTLLLDEQIHVLGSGTAGGTNLSQVPADVARQHMRDSLAHAFTTERPPEIDIAYVILVGDADVLQEELAHFTHVKRYVFLGEAQGGLLAGALRQHGLLALSGTGSDVFYCDAEQTLVVGGWGPYLGDDGSGAWIGQQALKAVVRFINGWGEKTCMADLITQAWHLTDPWQMVSIVHDSSAPFSKMASLTHVVGQAAACGDQVALDILRSAGHVMAQQMCSLIRRLPEVPIPWDITLCGGAWKTHPVMVDSFLTLLRQEYPDATAHRPLFEHVCAGAVAYLFDCSYNPASIHTIMNQQLNAYRIGGQ